MEFFDAVETRRTRYAISGKSLLTDDEIEKILRRAVKYTPSAFHSQTSRVVLLLGENHNKFWQIVMETLRNIVPAPNFSSTENKVNSFAAGYGTILYYEDIEIVAQLQKQFPTYADNFPIWSNQSSGMLQYVIWTALAEKGMGASLQHYAPLIDEEVARVFEIPKNWKLIAQMPFGVATAEPDSLVYKELETRVVVKA